MALMLGWLFAGGAAAEPSPQDRAIAERLYDQGRKQQADGQTAAACESFAESLRLDPGTGILLNLAACHEAVGRLASAWVEFREAVSAIRREARPDRMRYAQERLTAIEPRLAYLTIVVPESAEGDAPAVTLDGRTLGPAVWGIGIPVDAGWHEVVAQARAGTPWRATVRIRDGERRQVTVPAAFAGAAPTVPADAAGTPESPSMGGGVATAGAEPAASSRRARVIAGVALGAAGVGAVVVGAAFGFRASSLWDERNQACPMERCTAEGVSLGQRADSAATVSTWTIGAGAVALGAAAVVLLWPTGRAGTGATVARVLQHTGMDGQGRVFFGGRF